jgi:site-specific recombinase XerD
MAGVDLRTVAERMGHKSLQMTMRYAHMALEHKAAAVDKLVRAATDTKPEEEAA